MALLYLECCSIVPEKTMHHAVVGRNAVWLRKCTVQARATVVQLQLHNKPSLLAKETSNLVCRPFANRLAIHWPAALDINFITGTGTKLHTGCKGADTPPTNKRHTYIDTQHRLAVPSAYPNRPQSPRGPSTFTQPCLARLFLQM
jgi:hypothetical protein